MNFYRKYFSRQGTIQSIHKLIFGTCVVDPLPKVFTCRDKGECGELFLEKNSA